MAHVQFLGYEGRNSFVASNNYEKVKIINGATPQNIDLNEQSAIDEFFRRTVVKDGFGSGRVGISSLAPTYVGGSFSIASGTLWQDGYHFSLESSTNIDVSKDYKKIPPNGTIVNRFGNIYLVHAKQDYLDPARKLTVKDRSENSIQVDTGVMERRVWDIFIDWGDDEAGVPDQLLANSLRNTIQTLDETGVFSGKADFSESVLHGFQGYIFFLGTINLVGAVSNIDESGSELFNGAPDDVLYTGGDLAHRRDTEVAGIVITNPSGGTPAYEGLKVADGGSYGTEEIFDVTNSFVIRKFLFNALDTVVGEQLHIPSLNAYYALASNQTFSIINGTSFIKAYNGGVLLDGLDVMNSFPDFLVGTLSNYIFALVCTGGDLTNVNSYSIEVIADTSGSYDLYRLEIFSKNNKLIMSVFNLLIDDVSPGLGTGGRELLSVRTQYVSGDNVDYFWDKRNYGANSIEDVTFDIYEDVANQEAPAEVEGVLSAPFIVGENLTYSIGTDDYYVGKHVSDNGSNTMRFLLKDGVDYQDLVIGGVITSASLKTMTISRIISIPDNEPVVVKGRSLFSQNKTWLPYDASGTGSEPYPNKPSNLETALAKLRGALASMVDVNRAPGYLLNANVASSWNAHSTLGIKVPFIRLTNKRDIGGGGSPVVGLIAFDPPATADVANSSSKHIFFNYGKATQTQDRGKITFIEATRTLRDANGNKEPLIDLQGTSQTGEDFAEFIRLWNNGSTSDPIGQYGGMIVCAGKNGLIAVPSSNVTNYRGVDPWAGGDTGVVIDGQTGDIRATQGRFHALYSNIFNCYSYAQIANLRANGTTSLVGITNIDGTLNIQGDNTNITGDELEILSAGNNADALHSHRVLHSEPAKTKIICSSDITPNTYYIEKIHGGSTVLDRKFLTRIPNDPYRHSFNLGTIVAKVSGQAFIASAFAEASLQNAGTTVHLLAYKANGDGTVTEVANVLLSGSGVPASRSLINLSGSLTPVSLGDAVTFYLSLTLQAGAVHSEYIDIDDLIVYI